MPKNFSELPPELRGMIYEYSFKPSAPIKLGARCWDPKSPHSWVLYRVPQQDLSEIQAFLILARCNKDINEDASAFFYDCTEFTIDVEAMDARRISQPMKKLPASTAKKMQKINLNATFKMVSIMQLYPDMRRFSQPSSYRISLEIVLKPATIVWTKKVKKSGDVTEGEEETLLDAVNQLILNTRGQLQRANWDDFALMSVLAGVSRAQVKTDFGMRRLLSAQRAVLG